MSVNDDLKLQIVWAKIRQLGVNAVLNALEDWKPIVKAISPGI